MKYIIMVLIAPSVLFRVFDSNDWKRHSGLLRFLYYGLPVLLWLPMSLILGVMILSWLFSVGAPKQLVVRPGQVAWVPAGALLTALVLTLPLSYFAVAIIVKWAVTLVRAVGEAVRSTKAP
jgi:hypothetical protein